MIRKATVSDAPAIRRLVAVYADKGEMLPRALGDIYDSIRDFHVCEEGGELVGVAALHVGWEGIGEIRSVAVAPSHLGRGIGGDLVKACTDEARTLGMREVFVLTYVEGFFEKLGFKSAKHDDLPQKIWTECRQKCTKYPDQCNEAAMTLALD
jgi:amino-acid N-acetyltransferase